MPKRVGLLMPRICCLENLHEAFLRSVRGKAGKQAVVRMRSHLDEHLLRLQRELLDGTFRFGVYNFFEVMDPKRRTICASSFPERVAAHAMMRICHPVFEQYQTNDSFASRPGRGIYTALQHAQRLSCRHRWFAKLDVCKFFYSIHHEVMMAQLCRLFKDPLLLRHFSSIIRSYEFTPQRGLPIGNLTSQYFANHYLSVADHWAKEQLHVAGMARYMDDVLLFADDAQLLRRQVTELTRYMERELLLRLHEPVVNQTRFGIPFLGYVVHGDRLRLSGRSSRRFRQKMLHLADDLRRGVISEQEYTMRATCLVAFVSKADSGGYRRYLQQHYQGIYPEGL